MDDLPAPRELPAEMIMRPRIELSEESFDAILERAREPATADACAARSSVRHPINEDR